MDTIVKLLRISGIFLTLAFVVIGTLYVLDIVETEELRSVLMKTTLVLGIWTVGSIATVLLTASKAK